MQGILGRTIDAPVLGEVRFRDRGLVIVADSGEIKTVLEPPDPAFEAAYHDLRDIGKLVELERGQYLLPGLVDLHNHAPQWPQVGKALDVPLEVWLGRYTFPLEAKYADEAFAAQIYESLVSSMIANGTTTAMYFATTHLPATKLLADICLAQGQRALVGKVAMDHPDGCPDFYRDVSTSASIAATAELIEYIRNHPENNAGTVMPAITPRFVPSCTDELLAGLGELAEATQAHVQTHCSESDWAHTYGKERFGQTDTQTYLDFGLLRAGTVLAHCNFIDDADMAMIRDADAAVGHCPLSNFFFANAVFPARKALDTQVNVGLGTDVSGGPGTSIFSAAVNAVIASRVLEDGVDARLTMGDRGVASSRITYAEALWLATTGGGTSLELPIGLLEPGYWFDAIAVDTNKPGSDLTTWPDLDSDLDILQKILNLAGRQDVAKVWVQGREIKATV